MVKVLFICHGNICRSPMAEFVMKNLVEKRGISSDFYIESAATSTEEIGNPVYPPAKRKLAEHGISCDGKYARQVTKRDYQEYDYLIVMDNWNMKNLRRMLGADPEGKMFMLMSFAGSSREVADPWYTGNFDATWHDVTAGCEGLLDYLGY